MHQSLHPTRGVASGSPLVATIVALASCFAPLVARAAVDCTSPGRQLVAVPAPECVDLQGAAVACATPDSIRLWPSDLRPASGIPSSRYSTDRVAGLGVPGAHSGWEIFSSLDVLSVDGVAKRLYVSYNSGLQVWDLETDPADPRQLASRDGWPLNGQPGDFLSFPAVSEILHYLEDISALSVSPTEDLVGVAGKNGVGPTFWEYSEISRNLQQLYQDLGTAAQQIRLAADNSGTVYAFVGADDGIAVYDVTAASNLANPCLDDRGSTCPGVYRGLIDSRESPFLDVYHVPATDRFYVSSATKIAFNKRELKLWEVQDPLEPASSTIEKLSGLTWVHGGSALFSHLGHTYLAVVHEPVFQQEQLDIYLVDGCLQGGACNLATKAVQSIELKGVPQVANYDGYPAENDYLTFSVANGVPYLYYGFATGQLFGPSQEQLWDLSGIRHDQQLATLPELTSDGGRYWDPCSLTTNNQPYQVGYWGHYYHGNAHGLNNFAPRIGRFSPQGYFYRAAGTVLDVHVLGQAGGEPRISTDLVAAQSVFWMNEDEIRLQGSGSSGCSPDPDGWMWDATTPAEVTEQLVSAPAQTATFRFDCGLASGRCSDATVLVEVDNTATSCLGATLVAATVTPLKDPLPDITALSSGSSTSFVVCQPVELSAALAGRAPANWEWRIGGDTQCTGSQTGSDDLAGTTPKCTWLAARTEDVFADGFESGDSGAWSCDSSLSGCEESLLARVASINLTAELLVWDELGSPTNPSAAAGIVLSIDETSVSRFTEIPAVSGAAEGFAVTFSAPAEFTTGWHWELEDPFGSDSCTFAGVAGSLACSKHDTTVDSLVKSWAQSGSYRYSVVASNCASAETATATGVFTLEVGTQPSITAFSLTPTAIETGGPCCGNPFSGFTCQAGTPIEFQVTLVEPGSYQFKFDWERTELAAAPVFVSQAPTGNPTPTQWLFTHSLARTGSLYPRTRVNGGGLSGEANFLSLPLTVVNGTPSCQ